MIRHATIALACVLAAAPCAPASEFRHVGDFILQSHFKVTDDKVTPIPIKAMVFRVHTDGMVIRVSAGGEDAVSTFEIYRSDGIGRQRSEGGALEVIPGVQATSRNNNVLRHLRMTAESLTITTFPGVSDQTIISHAVAVEPIDPPDDGGEPDEQPSSP